MADLGVTSHLSRSKSCHTEALASLTEEDAGDSLKIRKFWKQRFLISNRQFVRSFMRVQYFVFLT